MADDAPRPWQARIRGFDLHTAVSARAGARERLERLCRYALRLAVVQERLRIAPDGHVVLNLAHGGRVGRRPNRAWAELMERSFPPAPRLRRAPLKRFARKRVDGARVPAVCGAHDEFVMLRL